MNDKPNVLLAKYLEYKPPEFAQVLEPLSKDPEFQKWLLKPGYFYAHARCVGNCKIEWDWRYG